MAPHRHPIDYQYFAVQRPVCLRPALDECVHRLAQQPSTQLASMAGLADLAAVFVCRDYRDDLHVHPACQYHWRAVLWTTLRKGRKTGNWRRNPRAWRLTRVLKADSLCAEATMATVLLLRPTRDRLYRIVLYSHSAARRAIYLVYLERLDDEYSIYDLSDGESSALIFGNEIAIQRASLALPWVWLNYHARHDGANRQSLRHASSRSRRHLALDRKV